MSLTLLLATALALMGTGLLSTLVAVRLVDGGVSDAASGVILACYFVGLTIGTLVLAPTIGRVGNARAFTAFTALNVSVCLAHGFIEPGATWALLRGLTGFSMAGLLMTVESWLNAETGTAQRGRVMAAYLIALYVGTGLGQLLLPVWPETGLEAFAIAALAISLAAILVSLTRMPQPSLHEASRLPFQELAREVPLGWAGAWLSGFVVGGIYASVPVTARASGLGAPEIAALMAAFIGGGLAGQWPFGNLSDRMDRRRVLLLVTTLLVALCFVLPMLNGSGTPVGWAGAFAFGALAFALYPLAVAHTLDRVGSDRSLPAAAQTLLASSIGSIVAPIVLPFASSALGSDAFYGVNGSLAAVFAGLVLWRMARVEGVPQEEYKPVPTTTAVVYELHPGIEEPPHPPGSGRSGAAAGA